MISLLHLRHFCQYPRSSQQCSLLHHSNIACYPQPFNTPIKFFCDTSEGSYHYRRDFYYFESPQSSNLSLQVLIIFHFLPFFLPYSYISWYSNIDDYTLLLFLFNSKNYACCLYHAVTLNINIPQHFHFFIFYCSFCDVLIPLFPCLLNHSFYKGPNGRSLLHYSVVSYVLSETISHIHVLSVEHFYIFFHSGL